MAVAEYEIKNWKEYQHYGVERRMLWVKLYGSIWRDRKFFALSDRIKLRFIALLTVAAESGDRKIPEDLHLLATISGLSFRKSDLKELVDVGLLVASSEDSASEPLESCGEEASSDLLDAYTSISSSISDLKKEEETKKQDRVAPAAAAKAQPISRRKPEIPIPVGFALDQEMAYYGWKRGLVDVREEFERFQVHAIRTDRRQRDWRAAWQQWVLNANKYSEVKEQSPRDPKITAAPTDDPVELGRRQWEAEHRENIKQRDTTLSGFFKSLQGEGARA